MSSPVASTSAAAVPVSRESPNSEAPPLPQKLGEIGYVPPARSEPEMREVDLGEPSLPARHPADRDPAQSPSSSSPPPSAGTTTNEESQPKKNRSWLGGIRIWSILQLVLLLGLMAGTAGAWWYTVKHFQDTVSMSQDQDNIQTTTTSYGWSSTIFVHVAFSVVALFEFVFLERNIFQIRAERYMFKHGMSPQARRDARRAASMGIAPWNRPPLPTYAAALAESGHGTGDVEDNLIAILPPPAYGNTRGSVLLLSSLLPSNLLRTFSRASQRSQRNTRPRSPEAGIEEGRRGRPLSYGASEEVSDAARARELEFALARLESNTRPQPTTSASSSQ